MKKINIRKVPTVLAATVLLGSGMVTTAASAPARPAPTPTHAAVAANTATVFDLNGTYTDGGSARPVISDVDDILTVDMSSQHRPNANGVVINSDTITVTFPDDATYGAKLTAPGIIRWSNGGTWRKLSFARVPDVVGMSQATATGALHFAGFSVAIGQVKITCEVQPGLVAEQNPPGGASIPVGSVVTIHLARKPNICL